MNDLEMHWDKSKVVVYDTARTQLEGWFTLTELRDIVQTMEYLSAAAKHSMEQNLSENIQ
jgi:hypothetical protein